MHHIARFCTLSTARIGMKGKEGPSFAKGCPTAGHRKPKPAHGGNVVPRPPKLGGKLLDSKQGLGGVCIQH
jgi:hypothetical protein